MEEVKETNCNCNDNLCEENCTCDENCTCEDACNNERCDDKKNKHDNKKLKKLEHQIEELEKKLKEEENKVLLAKADNINYRKRKDEDVARILKYSNEDIVKEMLPIIDNFESAIKMDDDNLEDEVSKFLEGFKLMYKQIKDLLEKFEVKEIDCLGKEFDPALEQAVVIDHDETKESGVVTVVLQKGYMYKDRVLRTAMVKVNE